MLREATYPPAAVNVLDVSSESMAAFQVFLYGRFWVFTEVFAIMNILLTSFAYVCNFHGTSAAPRGLGAQIKARFTTTHFPI